jgi:hypothetical protein
VASSRARRHAVRLLAARAGAACLPLDPVITTGDSSPNSTVDKRLRPELCEMIGLRLRCGAVRWGKTAIQFQSYNLIVASVQSL